MNYCQIGETGAYQISRGLCTSQAPLTKLSLAGNRFGDDGIQHIVEPFYSVNLKLEHINL